MSISIFILEWIELQKQGISALTKRLKVSGSLDQYVKQRTPFSSREEFINGLLKSMKKAHQSKSERKLLIISTHGISQTGTLLETANSAIDLGDHEIRGLFDVPIEEGLTVYVSACWGGYPGLTQNLRRQKNRIRILAPLVAVEVGHANDLQNQVIDILLKSEDFTEEILADIVRKKNQRLRNVYGEDPFILICEDGRTVPDQIFLGLAEKLQDKRQFRVVALQGGRIGDPVQAILRSYEGKEAKEWRAQTGDLLKEEDGDDCWLLFGVWVEARYKEARTPTKFSIGDIAFPSTPRRLKLPHSGPPHKKYPHSNDHVTQQSGAVEANLGQILASSPCVSCNWAQITFGEILSENGGTLKKDMTAVCWRTQCPERAS